MDPNQPTDQSQNPMGTPAADSGMGQPVGAGTPQQTPTPQEPTAPTVPVEPSAPPVGGPVTPEPSMPPVPQTPAPEEGGQTGEDTGVGSGTPPVTPAA